jgi:CheY-like chemotaxis protein
LKENAKTAAVPVIGLSARSADSDLDRASRLGFYRYLTKPVDVPQLLQTLDAVLEQTHAH